MGMVGIMSELPKCIVRPKEYPCFCMNCRTYRALEIAWEALEYFKYANGHEEDLNAVNAMRQITKLGESK